MSVRYTVDSHLYSRLTYTVDSLIQSSHLFELAVIQSSRLFEAIFISLVKPSLG